MSIECEVLVADLVSLARSGYFTGTHLQVYSIHGAYTKIVLDGDINLHYEWGV